MNDDFGAARLTIAGGDGIKELETLGKTVSTSHVSVSYFSLLTKSWAVWFVLIVHF